MLDWNVIAILGCASIPIVCLIVSLALAMVPVTINRLTHKR